MSKQTWQERASELQRLLDVKPPISYGEIARHFGVSRHTLRGKMSQLRDRGLIHYEDRETHHDDYEDVKKQATTGCKSSMEITKDGAYISDQPLWMTLDQVKDPAYIMKAHGFIPSEWELVTVKNNVWNTNDKIHGIQTLYASKITVKPRTQGWTFDDLLKAIREDIQPVHIETEPAHISDQRMLEIPFYDMHFGISDYDHYKRTQRDTYEILNSKRWEETLFIVGQDLLHNNDFSGKTANGTQIEVVDLPKAWKEARLFYITLIEAAIRQSNHVKIVYSRGNHDEAMSWAFVQMLMERYPQIEFEDSLEDRKVHTFGRIFLGITHGDEARKDLEGIFPQEFPLEWAQTTYRELHQGHLHREAAIDHFGLMSRTLATRNKTDKWHKRKGFVTAQKRFMLFEYTTDELKHIHYV